MLTFRLIKIGIEDIFIKSIKVKKKTKKKHEFMTDLMDNGVCGKPLALQDLLITNLDDVLFLDLANVTQRIFIIGPKLYFLSLKYSCNAQVKSVLFCLYNSTI